MNISALMELKENAEVGHHLKNREAKLSLFDLPKYLGRAGWALTRKSKVGALSSPVTPYF